MHMVINKTNQILDFDERHCINEYKSAYVLRCRSTNMHAILLAPHYDQPVYFTYGLFKFRNVH